MVIIHKTKALAVFLLVTVSQAYGAGFFAQGRSAVNSAINSGCEVIATGVRSAAVATVMSGYLYALSQVCKKAYAHDMYSVVNGLNVVQEITTNLNALGNVVHSIVPGKLMSTTLAFAGSEKTFLQWLAHPTGVRELCSDLLFRSRQAELSKLIVNPEYAATTGIVTHAKVFAANHPMIAPIAVGLIGLGVGYMALDSMYPAKAHSKKQGPQQQVVVNIGK